MSAAKVHIVGAGLAGLSAATILAAKMMLEWLGETSKAALLESAVAAVIKEGRVLTYDMGGNSTTIEMARAIAAKL